MGKGRKVHLPPVVVCHLVEENMESQALAMDQSEKLDEFERGEKDEDELKAWIKARIENTSGQHREDLLYILRKIEAIDKEQDSAIEDIRRYAKIIRRINYRSNALLKFYDVKGPYLRRRSPDEIHTPLFGIIKRRLGKR
ncbi:hypothetical protein DRO69_09150 [Candidatus Bathyarchaeota archaeon]|nr:MAG: hypothetical protein DRO69_09150 [Candidatus Bathyarchaeota archaeon]